MLGLFNNICQVLFYPPDATNTGVVDQPKGMGKEDIIDFLGGDEDEKPIEIEDDKKKEKKEAVKDGKETKEDDEIDEEETEDDEEDDDLSDLEDELEEPDDEKLELVTPVRRKEILAKYPKLFKDFPYLEKAYYREQQYTELLPTIDDAKQAVEDQSILRNFEGDLERGNTETILTAIKTNSPKSFAKVVDNYLGTLQKVDEKAYHHVIGNVLKHTMVRMIEEARESKQDVLQEAAQILHQFVFGTSKWIPPTKLSSDEPDVKDDKELELTRREQAISERALRDANNSLDTKVNNKFRATIEANIDPKDSMSDYVKKTATREAYEQLGELISNDSRFKIIVDKLWERAAREDYSKASLDRIESAFVSKARTLLPSVLKKARNEALRGMGKRVVDREEKDETPSVKKSPRKNFDREEREPSRSKSSDPKKIPSKMSTLEYLMSDD